MSIERQKGKLNFICDHCGAFVEGDDDFSALWAEAKEAGWRARKREDDGKWQHQCPDCAGARWAQ
jgi:hypothetical protein